MERRWQWQAKHQVLPEGVVSAPEPKPEWLQAVQSPSDGTQSKWDEPPRLIKLNGEHRRGIAYGEAGMKYALRDFLDELIAGKLEDLAAPHIVFGTITLKLRRGTGEYIAYGEPTGDAPLRVRIPDTELHSSGRADELEHNLRKFAMNERWRAVNMHFGPSRQLRVWKRRGGYGIAGVGLPATEEWWDWHPHS